MQPISKILFVIVIITGCMGLANAQVKTVTVQPKGEFAHIETQKTIAMINALKSKDATVKQKAVDTLLKNPNDYAPPALFLLSNILFDEGRKPQAMFWFYTAQLRTRSDVNKAENPSVDAIATQLSQQYGEEINAYSRQHLALLKTVVKKVVAWDKTQKRNYDPRWVLLSGMKSYTESKIEFKPKSEWQQIDAQTRKDYYHAFKEALIKMNVR